MTGLQDNRFYLSDNCYIHLESHQIINMSEGKISSRIPLRGCYWTILKLLIEHYPNGVEIDKICEHCNIDPENIRRYISKLKKYHTLLKQWLPRCNDGIYRLEEPSISSTQNNNEDQSPERIGAGHMRSVESHILEDLNKKALCMIDRVPLLHGIFEGRDDLLDQIHQTFSGGDRVLFLEGIGGIGKSEAAKRYYHKYRQAYDHVVFAVYSSTLEQLVCDTGSVPIAGIEKYIDETSAQFFSRKMQAINSLTTEKTLFIIDNFDVLNDPDLDVFLQGKHRVLFTTRYSHPGYQSIRINPIQDPEVLTLIFEKYYGEEVGTQEHSALYEIFEMLENHTYCIELIAKQMDASFLSVEQMCHLMKNRKLKGTVTEEISGKDGYGTAFQHMCMLFNTGTLTVEEKQVLMYLSLSNVCGISAKQFKEWAQFDNYNVINSLIKKSWVRKENGQRISLHPMIREVIHHELCPTTENCSSYLLKSSSFCYGSWFRPYHENLPAADTIESILLYFEDLKGSDYMVFQSFVSFLWQVGRFDASIYHGKRLYDLCVRDYGMHTMETGFAAIRLGGCYYNSGYKKDSIPWYKQGLACMLNSGAEETADLALAYEKVARCYTWEYEQDFTKAEMLFQKSVQIREQLILRSSSGDAISCMDSTLPCNSGYLKAGIGEVYMEMGRMYLLQQRYELAAEYAEKYLASALEYRTYDYSNIACGYYDLGVSQFSLSMERQSQEDVPGAEELMISAVKNLETALGINMKMRGTLALDTIDNQEYLADAYAAQNRILEASDGYANAVVMTEKLLGENHPRVFRIRKKMRLILFVHAIGSPPEYLNRAKAVSSDEAVHYDLHTSFPRPDLTAKKVNGYANEIVQIYSQLAQSNNKIALVGMGGIGKSELAKAVAEQGMSKFRTILWVDFSRSILETVTNDYIFPIWGCSWEDYPRDTINQYFQRKMRILRGISNREVLILLDGFNTRNDPHLEFFLSGEYAVVLTTRYEPELSSLPCIKIYGFAEEAKQVELFKAKYAKQTSPEDEKEILKIVRLLGGHIQGICVVASTMRCEGIQPREMHHLLCSIPDSGQGTYPMDEMLENMKKVFRLNSLNQEEQHVMLNMTMIPESGITIKEFFAWIGMTNRKVIMSLIERSLVVYDEYLDMVHLHPIIVHLLLPQLWEQLHICSRLICAVSDAAKGAYEKSYVRKLELWGILASICKRLPPDSEEMFDAQMSLALLTNMQGKSHDSIAIYRDLLGKECGIPRKIIGYARLAHSYTCAERLDDCWACVQEGHRLLSVISAEKMTPEIRLAENWLLQRSSDCARRWNRLQEAEEYGRQAISLLQTYGDETTISDICWSKYHYAYALLLNRKLDESQKILQEAIRDAEQRNLQYLCAYCQGLLGQVLMVRGDYQQALEFTNMCTAVLWKRYESREDNIGLFSMFLGNIYRSAGDEETARQYYTQSANAYGTFSSEREKKVRALLKSKEIRLYMDDF